MVTIACSVVSIICYIVAIIGREISTKFPSVSTVGANMELICRGVVNIGELMQQSLLSDVHEITSVYQQNKAHVTCFFKQITVKSGNIKPKTN